MDWTEAMTDHQQAALTAMQDEIYRQLNCQYGDFNIPSEEEAKSILAAAEPHLRRKWAAEMREKVNPPDVDYSHEWRRGFTVGAIKASRFVEGAGNE